MFNKLSGLILGAAITAATAPEPGTWLLVGFGFAGLVVVRRRRAQQP
jgi:hypothetical protein